MDTNNVDRGHFISQSTFPINLDSSCEHDHAKDDLLDLSWNFSLKQLNVESTKFSYQLNFELMNDYELFKCTRRASQKC